MSDIQSAASLSSQDKKMVRKSEFILYLIAVFFYTNMTGMIGSYRNAYIVNVLRLTDSQASLYNTLISIIPFVLNFFLAMYIDGRKVGKMGKFKPLGLIAAVPAGILLVLTFITPKALSGTILMIYIVTIAVLWSVATSFGNSVNMVAIVMTPNMKERDTVISFRSIVSAVGNSAPLVILLVIGLIWKDNEGLQYIIGAGLCGVVGVIAMLIGMKAVRERVTYTAEKKNPLVGFKDILTNKYAWAIIVSDTLKSFRNIATYLGPFLAAALLGSTSKFLLFGLPTGIGTAVGMLIINFLLKKFNSKVLYIASGIYSVIINAVAFGIGYSYFRSGNKAMQIVFIVALYAYSMVVSLGHGDMQGTAAVAILLVMPCIFNYRPIYMISMTLLAMIVYCSIAAATKSSSIAMLDLWNSLFFGIIAMLLSIYQMRVKFNVLLQKRRNKELSEIDMLTGTKNRNSFEQNRNTYAVTCKSSLACIYIDVNGLHNLNDDEGHDAGDKMLCTVAHAITVRFGKDNTYRIGGDEFVAFCADRYMEEIDGMVKGMIRSITDKGYSVSVGVSCREKEDLEMKTLIREAEKLMYREKARYYQEAGHDRRHRSE